MSNQPPCLVCGNQQVPRHTVAAVEGWTEYVVCDDPQGCQQRAQAAFLARRAAREGGRR